MRPSELKTLNEANGGNFFNAKTMGFWGDTMRNFRCRDNGDGTVTLYRQHAVKYGNRDEYVFNKKNGLKLRTITVTPDAAAMDAAA